MYIVLVMLVLRYILCKTFLPVVSWLTRAASRFSSVRPLPDILMTNVRIWLIIRDWNGIRLQFTKIALWNYFLGSSQRLELKIKTKTNVVPWIVSKIQTKCRLRKRFKFSNFHTRPNCPNVKIIVKRPTVLVAFQKFIYLLWTANIKGKVFKLTQNSKTIDESYYLWPQTCSPR